MKKKNMLLTTTVLSLSLLTGCHFPTTVSDTKSDSAPVQTEDSIELSTTTTMETASTDASTIETEETIDEVRTPDPYHFLIHAKNKTGYIDSSANLHGTYEFETEHEDDDQFFDAYITWNLPLEIIAEDATTVTFASGQSFFMTGDYEDAILSCEEEAFYEETDDDTQKQFYSVTFDYDKLAASDYSLFTRRICQRGLFFDDYDNMFTETTDLEQKYFDFGGFEDTIVSILVTYQDGSICMNSIQADLEYVDADQKIVSEASASDVAISITTTDEGTLLKSRPADGGEADMVYYGDTIVATVKTTSQTAGEEAISNPEKADVHMKIMVPNENFERYDEMESYTSGFNTCSLYVGHKVGDVIENNWDFGDTCYWETITITGIE